MAFTENLAEFLDTDEFAVTASIGGNSVVGIFDDEYIEEEGFAGTVPLFLCRSSDVSGVDFRTTTLTHDGTTYTVMHQRQDGTGMTTLVLKKQ